MFRVQNGADDKLFIMFIVLQKKSGKIMNTDRFSVKKKPNKTNRCVSHNSSGVEKHDFYT